MTDPKRKFYGALAYPATKPRKSKGFDRRMPGVDKSLQRRESELPLGAVAKKQCIPSNADEQLAAFVAAGRVTKCPEFTPRSSGFVDDAVEVGGRKPPAP